MSDIHTALLIVKQIENAKGLNEKLDILRANKDNAELKKLFNYTYNKVDYSFRISGALLRTHITSKNKMYFTKIKPPVYVAQFGYTDIFELLDALSDVIIHHTSRLGACKEFLDYCYYNDQLMFDTFCKILDRDLKIGLSVKSILSVWKDLIPKPHYCRCDVCNDKNLSKIIFPCYVQLKCDGTYRECRVENHVVSFKTRSGEPSTHPILERSLVNLPDGYYLGEFTIGKADEPDENRAKGNGLINSDNPPYERIHFTVWDYLTDSDYALKTKSPYKLRFYNLNKVVSEMRCPLFEVVPTYTAYDKRDVVQITSKVMKKGLEGTVVKDYAQEFKNGTSKMQLKFKLAVDCEMRCVGFEKGQPGTKYENMNKVIVYENDDRSIRGTVSGLTDPQVREVTEKSELYKGKVFTLQFNDLLDDNQNKGFCALSHPRFIEWRNDKNETDDLNKVKALIDMAKNFKG